MLGTIYLELEKFVVSRFGNETWQKLLTEASVRQKSFDPLKEYPDAMAMGIVGAASRALGVAPQALLADFGKFIAPDLLEMYWGAVEDEWRTLDLLEHTETVMHKVVRLKNPNAAPPALHCERRAADKVVIHYNSPRRLCGLAEGLIQGIANHYGENVSIQQATCMLQGAPKCEIHVDQHQ